jgi:O-antigen ligase
MTNKAQILRIKGLSGLDIPVLLFTGSAYLSALAFNPPPYNTDKLMGLALLLVLYFVFRWLFPLFEKQKIQTVCCFILILSGLVEALWGLRQLYGFAPSQHALFRLTGSFFNPGPYAGYLAVVFPLSLHFGMYGRLPVLRGLAAITCIAVILVLPATMSRAAWLAALAGSAAVVGTGSTRHPLPVVKRPSAFFKGWRIGRALTVGIVVLLLLAALTGMYFLKKNSADGRALIWKLSLQTLVHHPLGAGLGNFSGAYGETQAAYFASGRASETEALVAGNPEYGFNEYLQIGIESGIVSLLLFIVLLIRAFRCLRRKKDGGVMGALTALAVFACFSYPFGVWPFLIVFVFLLASSHPDSALKRSMAGTGSTLHPLPVAKRPLAFFGGWRIKFAMTGLFLIAFFCLYKQYPVYRANKTWNEKRMYYQSGRYREAIQSYEPLYPYLNDRVQFLFEYAQCLSKTGINGGQGMEERVRRDNLIRSNKVLQRAMQISCDPMLYNILGKNYQAMKEYAPAEAAYIRATQLVPSRLYPWYLLTKLYDEMGLTDKACETAKIVLTKEPKVQSPAVREMRSEVKKYCP